MLEGLWIPESFLAAAETNEETMETSALIFVEGANGKLESRSIQLGMYDWMTGCYEVLSGVSPEDYVANPQDPGCTDGAAVMRREPEDFAGAEVPVEDGTAADDNAVTEDAGMMVEDGTAADENTVAEGAETLEIVTEE